MKKMRKTKSALLHSAIALLLCISMLIGSTFAWFTDSVSSGKNIITAGNLDLEMYWTEDLSSGKWYNVEEDGHNTIFNYDNWEPGYTDVKYIKLVNAGDLALNYKLSLTPQNGIGKLAEVINVYYAEGGVAVAQRSDLKNLKAIGLLDHVLDGGATADGTLLAADQYSPLHPSGEVIMTVAMNMLTTAGNEYQNEDAGEFSITAIATQAPYESDSFGSDYDADAEFPNLLGASSVSGAVTPVNGKVPAGGVTLRGEKVSAFIPEGVALKDGVSKLTLTITPLKNSTSDIIAVNNEILIPVDVHIDGIAETNDVPIIIDLGEVLPKYLNMGNYRLFHVENGTNNEMTLVADKAALTAHNRFTYEPLTGAVSVAMASFSEVTMLADTAAKWEGKEDYDWYTNEAKSAKSFTIANADQLYAFAKIVGGMVDGVDQYSFAGDTVKLLSDINLNYGTVLNTDGAGDGTTKKIFYPVGYWNNDDKANYDDKTDKDIDSGFYTFEGTFDGNGHTISNIYQNTWEMKGDHEWYAAKDQHYRDGMGLFGKVYGGTIKNLTVDNFKSDGEITTTGVIASYADGATFENIAITNCNPRVYNIGNGGIVGCVGWYAKDANLKTTFKNITVDNSNTISALWGSYDVACGGIVGQYYPTSGQTSAGTPKNAGIHFENCHVAAVMDVYNDVCGNYQYYAYRYAGMMIGSIRENLPADANGHIYPDMTDITATGCTVHYDSWNDYYYCELVANSKASYTHDHQFSRLEQVENVEGTTITPLEGDPFTVPGSGRYNYVVVDDAKGHGTDNATCYHFVNGEVWNHADAGFEDFDLDGNGKLDDYKEDHEHIYLPFKQLFTGYGWGVTSRWLEAFDGIGVTERDSKDLIDKFEKNNALSGDFLYRVGNGNAFPIGKLFQAIDENLIVDSGVYVSVDSLVEGVKFAGTFVKNESDWTKSTLHITGGTGPARLTIQDYNNCKEFSIAVEVVDGKNHYSETISSLSGNTVLLNNTKLTSGNALSLSNASLYGNDFTLDVTAGRTTGGSASNNFLLNLASSIIDNVRIVGAVYTKYGAQVADDYNNPVVRSSGNSSIINSYIANCASPVRVMGGNLEIVNSTLKGGNFANLDIRNGHVTLDSVTTINQVNSNDVASDGTVVVGLGIVVFYENVSNTTTVDVVNGITQYNHLSKTQADTYISDTQAKTLLSYVFENSATAGLRYTNNDVWVNTGILSMSDQVGDDNISDVAGYTEATLNALGGNRYVHTIKPDATSIEEVASPYTTVGQGAIAPQYDFAYKNDEGDPNYKAKDNTNDFCYQENGTVYISMDKGDTFNWDTSILNATKNGKTLSYTVSMGEVDYTGKSIPFNTAGNYKVNYTYTDSNNYELGKDGKITVYDKTYSKTIHINVVVIEDTTVYTEFKFGSNAAQETEKIVVNNNTYISAKGVAHDNSKWSYITVDNQKIYYPIVKATIVNKKTAYFNIFKNAVTIISAADDKTYDGETNTMPSGLKVVNGKYGAFTSISSNWSRLNDTDLNFDTEKYGENMGGKVFSYAASDGTYASVTNYNNALVYKSPDLTNARDEYYTIAKYSFTDATGTYYYYVGYHMAAKSAGTECVTGDTLVTLADGTQKRVDALNGSEKLLVWNHETGKLDTAPVAYIVDHNGVISKREIIHLNFANGKTVKIIGEHVFFDTTLNKYVAITSENADTFVGHAFAALSKGGSTMEKVKLASVERTVEETVLYEVVTYKHLTCFTEGVLSTSAHLDPLLNVFDIETSSMAYSLESVQKDIETYGLYTYADFEGLISEEAFDLYNAQYLKIAVGKGYITWNDILNLIDIYFNVDVQPIK